MVVGDRPKVVPLVEQEVRPAVPEVVPAEVPGALGVEARVACRFLQQGAVVVVPEDQPRGGRAAFAPSSAANVLKNGKHCASDDVAPAAAAFSPDGRTLFVACPREVVWLSSRGTQGAATLGSVVEPSEGLRWAGPMVALQAGGEARLLVAERSTDPMQNDRVALWSTTTKRPLWSIDLGSHSAPARAAPVPCNRAASTPFVPGLGAGAPGPWGGLRPGLPAYGRPPSPCGLVATRAPSDALDGGPPMALSSDHERLLVGGRGLCLWRMSDGQPVRCLVAPEDAQVTAVAWAPGDAFAIEAERALASTTSPAAVASPHRVRVWKGDAIALR